MTTFKAKNIFLVFGMGHTMNKLTNEYKKMQNFKNLVDLQCKCVKIFEFQKKENVPLSEIEFRREACFRFFEIQKF